MSKNAKAAFTIVFFIIIGIWVYGVQVIRMKISNVFDGVKSENIHVTYRDIKIGGIPYTLWNADIAHLALFITDSKGEHKFFSEKSNISFDFKMENATFDFGKEIEYTVMKNGGEKTHYKISSDENITANILFTRSCSGLFTYEELVNNIRGISSNIAQLSWKIGKKEVKDIFEIDNLKLHLVKNVQENFDDVDIKIELNYKSLFDVTKIREAKVFVDSEFLINRTNGTDKGNSDFDRKLTVSDFLIQADDASMRMNGQLYLKHRDLPHGMLNISMNKYAELVYLMIPDEFIISQSYLTNIIEKASSQNNDLNNIENANFDITFSDRGVEIGSINIVRLMSQ